MMRWRALTLACLALAALGPAASALAQERGHEPERQREPRDADRFLQLSQFRGSQWDLPRSERAPDTREKSLSEILRMLKSRFSGRHLDAQRMGDYYLVSWITEDGQRLTLRVNAITGNVE